MITLGQLTLHYLKSQLLVTMVSVSLPVISIRNVGLILEENCLTLLRIVTSCQ